MLQSIVNDTIDLLNLTFVLLLLCISNLTLNPSFAVNNFGSRSCSLVKRNFSISSGDSARLGKIDEFNDLCSKYAYDPITDRFLIYSSELGV